MIGCSHKEEALSDKSVLDGNSTSQTELDKYIFENFQKPYNIKVTYKYIDSDFEQAKYLYPPTESKVKPLLEVITKVWIEPYIYVAAKKNKNFNFIKEVAPRQISLIGGYNVNTNGTITLGFADSGMKITLFNVDQLDLKDEQRTRQYFHTIQHEYCHIINQTKPFSVEYGQITPADYTSNWYNVSNTDALNKGFISPYSMLNEIEDFAEMTSAILSLSKAEFDAKVNAVSDAKGKEILRLKESYVVEYFKKEWNLDIYELQELIDIRMKEILQ
ncbi:hypothetical protein RCZ15_14140 [Capnocytophaga catalasegens]|uniref:Substrate import-associated zinc metallohydrolase lipoprotein n=2 Tax=Capnocytophaga catalasegens TaxID=1004260 RepID=A0AAV5AT21_9FLAO|nr:hypothetical protein RCZ03_19540 [Capnocytophaga catalasegens]GJM50441.1 hypothetical protein RCZ15_14140 [Capnocytophaga catalasegens]GJM53936.1 hypothetical protein RCZ16_22520 [Capnocytophaga catalasegens]